jgi:hypothetical protein
LRSLFTGSLRAYHTSLQKGAFYDERKAKEIPKAIEKKKLSGVRPAFLSSSCPFVSLLLLDTQSLIFFASFLHHPLRRLKLSPNARGSPSSVGNARGDDDDAFLPPDVIHRLFPPSSSSLSISST